LESVRGVTATAGSNPALSAKQSANLFSGRVSFVNKARFPGVLAPKITTMRRTIRLSIRPIRGLSTLFLRAMIVEWLFPMHIDEMPARLPQMSSPESHGPAKRFA
jgi:hypothetical protein